MAEGGERTSEGNTLRDSACCTNDTPSARRLWAKIVEEHGEHIDILHLHHLPDSALIALACFVTALDPIVQAEIAKAKIFLYNFERG